jgi:hypothetical protein
MDNKLTALNASLDTIWRRTQLKHIFTGLLTMCIWAIPIFMIGMLVDRYAYLPSSARWVVLLILLGVALYKAWRSGWFSLRSFDAKRSAHQIESHQKELDSLLFTALQYRESGATPGTSSALWEASLQKAEEASKSLRISEIVDFSALKRPLRLAIIMTLVIGTFGVFNASFLAVGIKRIFAPWTTTFYPTKTQIEHGNQILTLKEGDAAKIEIQISGDVPKTAEFEIVTGEGRSKEIDIELKKDIDKKKGVGTYAIASASRDFSYRIKAGDARSDWHDVRVIPAPRIDDVKVVLDYPTYLQKPQETIEALTLTVPESTRVKWQLSLDQPIQKAVLNRDGQEPLELKISNNGRELIIEELVQASRGYSFSWIEKNHGFEFTSPRYYMQVASDQAPRVELVSPESNVVAMLGRQLDLMVRASDDYGIGSASVIHRVNLRPEKIVPLTKLPVSGGGEQKIEWDYRKELADLQIGDTVSFLVEIADRYPTPHVARTDTRRITFVSREDYLAQIEKKLDRLLSRVRAIYRQERSAHALVKTLDVNQPSFSQTCQLEAIRQEMLRQQLKETVTEVRFLLADLDANNISGAVENESLKLICAELEKVSDETLAKAASLLRDVAGLDTKKANDGLALMAADAMVNQSARELAKVVLQRGIDPAREVFALELHMLSQEQAKLRQLTVDFESSKDDKALELIVKQQEELAGWTTALLTDLEKGMRYDKRPLSVLTLLRGMKETAALIQKQQFAQASEKQLQIIKPLLKAEYSVRTGAEYAAIKANHEMLSSLLAEQVKLRTDCEALKDDQFVTKRDELIASQTRLRKLILQAIIPSIPAPRTRLLDQALPVIPPVDALRAATEKGMTETLAELGNGSKATTIAKLQLTEKSLGDLNEIVKTWSAQLALQTQGLTSLVTNSTKRLTRIEDCENRQIALLEQTEEAALDKKPVKALAEAQRRLAEEMVSFKKELLEQNRLDPDKDVVPILKRIERIGTAMTKAAVALESNKAEDALLVQEEVSEALASAKKLVAEQGSRLGLIQGIFSFQKAVSNSYQATIDVVDQQNDLIKACKALDENDEKAIAKLLPTMKNLLQCLADVAPLLDAVAIRLDAGSALLFAGSDVEDAIASMEDGDMEDALDAQEGVAESLTKVKGLIYSVTGQTNYLAEIIEFLHESLAEVALLESEQLDLRSILESKPGEMPADVVKRLEQLQKTTESHGNLIQGIMGNLENFKAYKAAKHAEKIEKLKAKLVKIDPLLLEGPEGISDYTKAAKTMTEALRFSKSGDSAAAIEQMKIAETALNDNGQQLYSVISMLYGLSIIEVLSTSPPELPILLDVLALASEQRTIYQKARFDKDVVISDLMKVQEKLDSSYLKLTQVEAPNAILVSAQKSALQATKAPSREEVVKSLAMNDESLRHYIIEQALILDTSLKPAAASSDPVITEAETDDLTVSDLAMAAADFASGEAPKDKRTEWEVLGTRNRAALNQNFARELPLEYRGMLKDYYEKVAK